MELYRDMLLALMSAGLGAVLGTLLMARIYEKKIAHLQGQVAVLEGQVASLITQLARDHPNEDGRPI